MNGKNRFCNSGGTCHWNWILCTSKTGSYWRSLLFKELWDLVFILFGIPTAEGRLLKFICTHKKQQILCRLLHMILCVKPQKLHIIKAHWGHGNVSLNNNRTVQNGKWWISWTSRWNSGISIVEAQIKMTFKAGVPPFRGWLENGTSKMTSNGAALNGNLRPWSWMIVASHGWLLCWEDHTIDLLGLYRCWCY